MAARWQRAGAARASSAIGGSASTVGGPHEDQIHGEALSVLAGVALGALAMQGLHAQATKLKAYSVSELDPIDTAAQAAYLPGARKAIEAHHGKALRTAAGRVVAPQRARLSSNGRAWTMRCHFISRRNGRPCSPSGTSRTI